MSLRQTSNEKMKLVFQLTDQKHFIHYNQAFIWRDLFCVRVCVCTHMCMWACVRVCAHVNTLFMLLFAMLLLVIATPRRSLWHFPTFCTRTSWLPVSVYVILCLIFHCCIHHSPSQINYAGQISNYIWLSCYRDWGGRQGWSIHDHNGQNSDTWHHIKTTRWVNKKQYFPQYDSLIKMCSF